MTVAPRRRERLCGSEPRCSPFASRAFCVYTRSCFLGAIPRTHVWSAERLKGFVCPVRCMHVPASPAPSGWLLALAYLLTRTCCLSSVVLSARWPLPAQGALVYFNSILKLLKRRGLKVYLSCDRWADLHGGACELCRCRCCSTQRARSPGPTKALRARHGSGTGAADRNLDGGMADTACSYTGCYRRGRGKGLPFPLHCTCNVSQKYR